MGNQYINMLIERKEPTLAGFNIPTNSLHKRRLAAKKLGGMLDEFQRTA
jgi:hypothetical protein